MDIKLEYLDRSEDSANVNVVVFQKNVAADFDSLAIAWKVIHNCGRRNTHPFIYPEKSEISARDAWGNHMRKLTAESGRLYHVKKNPSGHELAYRSAGTSREEIQLQNDLVQGNIDALIFKDDRLMARKTSVAPGQKAVFRLMPVLYLTVASGIEEGQALDSAVISTHATEISLHGLASARIVMTGGGAGADTEKFSFSLQNVVSN